MALYVPPLFATAERAAIARLIHDHPFATLVTPAVPEPWISHVPLLLAPDGEPHGTLIGHVARANPHWQFAQGVESIAIFHGPHAYVSPSWYLDPVNAVPTWNFATVHAHGTLEIFENAADARSVLDALVQRFEGGRPAPWRPVMPERQHAALISSIVAFRLPIKRLDAKFKLSQNRSHEDRVRVIAALKGEDHSEATATAAWMQSYALPGTAHDEPK
jgi:transcriptional regulator